MKNKTNEIIYVTKPALPGLDEFLPMLQEIWESRILTNHGPFHNRFESALAKYLGVEHVSLFTNATLALLTGVQALELSGEVITTPFSFVATAHSLWWNNIKPVFVDIESRTYTIDPVKIERAISERTTAILPVHVYGYPCDTLAIGKIASTYGLKVIYDAAHFFGERSSSENLLRHGDMSILSFHATKVFNTFEGGAIVSRSAELKKKVDYLRNFGFESETSIVSTGINAKMNEFQAALGLLQLRHIEDYIKEREIVHQVFIDQLSNIKGITLPPDIYGFKLNYGYFPILIESKLFGETRDRLYERLKRADFYSRRYFYPLISHFPPYSKLDSSREENLPVATRISSQILCLPIYPGLTRESVIRCCDIIKNRL